jgi:threonyl-tRNA synthetase
MNAKIRNAQNRKIPYMLIVGEKEASSGTVSIRPRKGEQIQDQRVQDAVDFLREKAESRAEI